MKPNIHPKYNNDTKVVCACGQTFATGSTMAEIHTEICSNCHPFYTGKQNLIDTAGRVDRFQKLTAKSAAKKTAAAERKTAKAASASGGKKVEKVEVATDKK